MIVYVTVKVTQGQRRRRESAKKTAKRKNLFLQSCSSHMRNFTSIPMLLELH